MTRKPVIPIPLTCSAVALATTLWAGAASAGIDYWSGLFHVWENQRMCINNPYQGSNDGVDLVANENCGYSDFGSRLYVVPEGDHVRLVFYTNGVFNQNRYECIDNHFGEQWDGNHITRYTCNDGDAQKWDWDGTSFHYHANRAYCISVNSDGKLVLWHCMGHGNQKFVLTGQVYRPQSGGLGGESPGKGPNGGCVPEYEGRTKVFDCD
jgi:hypothetical protein